MQIDSKNDIEKTHNQSLLISIARILIVLCVIGFGIVIGGYLGFVGLFYGCQLYDYFNPPSGAGSGLMAVGWIFAFFTIPIGAVLGAIFSVLIYRKLSKKIMKSS